MMNKRKSDNSTCFTSSICTKKSCPPLTTSSVQALSPAELLLTPLQECHFSLSPLNGSARYSPLGSPSPAGVPVEFLSWITAFLDWNFCDRLQALKHLTQACDPESIKYLRNIIEPYFRRDFIGLLPSEVSVHILSFLDPEDLLRATHTCRTWRRIAEDTLLWREKCDTLGIVSWGGAVERQLDSSELALPIPRYLRHCPYKALYIRHSQIESNWRQRPLRDPKILRGHDDHVITCLQLCGQRKIISGSDDNTLKIWDSVSGEFLHTLQGHMGGVWCSQLTEDEQLLVSGSTDRNVRVWSVETGECLHVLQGHTSTVRCLAIQDYIAISGSRDTTLRAWNLRTGTCMHTLNGHLNAVRCVQFDGQRVVSGAYDFTVKIWDLISETCIHTLSGHVNRVYSLQFDPVRNIVVSGSLDTTIRVWDASTGQCLHTLLGHKSLNSDMHLRDNILISGNADSTVRVWDIPSGRCLHVLSGVNKHESAVTCLDFLDSGLVVTSSDDGTVKLWNALTGEFIRDLVRIRSGGHGGVVWRLKASRSKLVCAAGSRNGVEETKLMVLNFGDDILV